MQPILKKINLTKMETNKNLVDAMVETQSKTINNWVETTQKLQKAVVGGQAIDKGSDLYKDWLNNQMDIFNSAATEAKTAFTNTASQNTTEATEKSTEFFKNWYNSQMNSVKQMIDFNQSLYNNTVNFGKPATDLNSNFKNMNDTFTSFYTNWMNAINASYDNLSKNLTPGLGKDAFTSMFNYNTTFNKMQEVFEPWTNAMKAGNFNAETFKSLVNPTQYKEIIEKMFTPFFNNNDFKSQFEKFTQQMEQFVGSQTNVSKDFYEKMKEMQAHLPMLFSGDYAKLTSIYSNINTIFQTNFSPMMKLVAPSKEKEMAQMMIDAMDKATLYSIKQSQMQYLLFTAGQTALEKTAEMAAEKMKDAKEITSANQLYSEWVNMTEKIYTDLFASDEYSVLKGEILSTGLTLKKDFEKQFEITFENTPFAFKSQLDEMYKTIHDLKKQVRELQTRLALNTAATTTEEDETKVAKNGMRKK